MNLKALLTWSQQEFHQLPWRVDRSLYGTLVSEIMLQQTTVGTVKNHYERFLKTFPDLKSLARASEAELLVAWKGLGYYRRARNLKKIAEALARDHRGEFPPDQLSLQEINGIGPYTANALVAIGMDRPALAVDANLERVIARLYAFDEVKGIKLQKHIQQLFAEGKIFADRKISYRKVNEALMDLGRTICQARKATCELCPLKKDCRSFALGNPLQFPLDPKVTLKKKQEHEVHLLRVYAVKGNKILVYQKSDKEWLSGQYEVPTFILNSTDKKLVQYPAITMKKATKIEETFKSGITKYKILNSLIHGDQKKLKDWGFDRKLEWRELSAAESNLSTATTKGLVKLGYL